VTLKVLAYLLLALAAGSAILAARRSRDLAPLAALLCVSLVSSAGRAALPGDAALLERVLVIADPVALAVTAARVYGVPVARLALAGGLLLVMVAAGARGAAELRLVYLAAELGGLALATGSAGSWVIRVEQGRAAHLALALVVAFEALVVVEGPWRWGLWVRWELAQVAYCVLYGALAALMLGWRAAR
jgi:hypothetical protein